jgi:hypothetical protein
MVAKSEKTHHKNLSINSAFLVSKTKNHSNWIYKFQREINNSSCDV